MMKCMVWFRRIDALCARLNAGLTAVAVALSIVFAIVLTVRASVMLDDVQQQLAAHGNYAVLNASAN